MRKFPLNVFQNGVVLIVKNYVPEWAKLPNYPDGVYLIPYNSELDFDVIAVEANNTHSENFYLMYIDQDGNSGVGGIDGPYNVGDDLGNLLVIPNNVNHLMVWVLSAV